MRTRIALSALVMAGATLVACPSSASAVGTPGEPNCVGKTKSALAQVGGPNGSQGIDAPGVGNAARYSGVTVAEAQAIVRAFCTP